MTLQWTAVAVFLYGEIFVLFLLMLPWIRPQIWQKLFKSRAVRSIQGYSHIYVYGFAAVLLLLFFDAIREVRKYSEVGQDIDAVYRVPNADSVMHMRLFRAQRNLYIAGFALFLWFVIKRVVDLIGREAHLMASAEAAMKQAQGASSAAEKLLSENKLKKEAVSSVEADNARNEELNALKETIAAVRKELKSAEADRDTMKQQAENLQKEYDRLSEEFSLLQDQADKKID